MLEGSLPFRSLACCACALALLVACKGGSKSGTPAVVAKPPPSPVCGAAAATLAGLDQPGATPDEIAPQVKELTDECHSLGFTDAEAQCVADSTDKLAALKCPRALGRELREVEGEIGTGKCRPVMLTMHLAEIAQLRQIPPDQRMEAIDTFKVVKAELSRSCRTDDWGSDAMDCFANTEVMRAFGCIEKVPRDVLDRLDARLKVAMSERQFGGSEDELPPDQVTGVAACDSYLRRRNKFEACEAAPAAAKSSMLAAVAPLEKPWRSLPPAALAATGATFTGLCEQASGQLVQLAGALGCEL